MAKETLYAFATTEAEVRAKAETAVRVIFSCKDGVFEIAKRKHNVTIKRSEWDPGIVRFLSTQS